MGENQQIQKVSFEEYKEAAIKVVAAMEQQIRETQQDPNLSADEKKNKIDRAQGTINIADTYAGDKPNAPGIHRYIYVVNGTIKGLMILREDHIRNSMKVQDLTTVPGTSGLCPALIKEAINLSQRTPNFNGRLHLSDATTIFPWDLHLQKDPKKNVYLHMGFKFDDINHPQDKKLDPQNNPKWKRLDNGEWDYQTTADLNNRNASQDIVLKEATRQHLLNRCDAALKSISIANNRVASLQHVEELENGRYRVPFIKKNVGTQTNSADIIWHETSNDCFIKLKRHTQHQVELSKNSVGIPLLKKRLEKYFGTRAINLGMLLSSWSRWSWEPEQNANYSQSLKDAIVLHNAVNTLQLLQSSTVVALDAVKLVYKTLQPAKTVVSTISKSPIKVVPIVNVVLDIADIGLSAYEFSQASNKAQTAVLGTQLLISGANLVVSGGVLVAGLMGAKVLAATLAAAMLPLTLASLAAGYYINRYIVKEQIQSNATAVREYFARMALAYQQNSYSSKQLNAHITSLAPNPEVVFREVNFKTKQIHFGRHRLYQAQQKAHKDLDKKGHTDRFIEMSTALNQPVHINLAVNTPNFIILPGTPSTDFYYIYEDASKIDMNEIGCPEGSRIMHNIATHPDWDPQFEKTTLHSGSYTGAGSTIKRHFAAGIQYIYHATTIKIVLDNQVRFLQVPKPINEWKNKLHYEIEGSSGSYVVNLEQETTVKLIEEANQRSSWLINAQAFGVRHEDLRYSKQGIMANNQHFLLFDTKKIPSLQLIDGLGSSWHLNFDTPVSASSSTANSVTVTAQLLRINLAKWKAQGNDKQIGSLSDLAPYLTTLKQSNQLSLEYLPLDNHSIYKGFTNSSFSTSVLGRAYYHVSDNQFLWTENADFENLLSLEFILDILERTRTLITQGKTPQQLENYLSRAQTIDNEMPHNHYGQYKFIHLHDYLPTLTNAATTLCTTKHAQGHIDCPHFSRLLTAEEVSAKKYQYFTLWISRFKKTIAEVKGWAQHVAEAELADVHNGEAYFYHAKQSMFWSTHSQSKKLTAQFHFLFGTIDNPISNVFKKNGHIYIERAHTFNDGSQGSFLYALANKKLTLVNIYANTTLLSNTNLINTEIQRIIRAQAIASQSKIHTRLALNTATNDLYWVENNNRVAEGVPAVPLPTDITPQLDAIIAMTDQDKKVHSWLRTSDQFLIKPHFTQAIPSDLALVGITQQEDDIEIFCFHSPVQKTLWLQQYSKTNQQTNTSQFIIPDLASVYQNTDNFVITSSAGKVETINAQGERQLIGVTQHWWHTQLESNRSQPIWQPLKELAQTSQQVSLDVFTEKGVKKSLPSFWYRDGKIILSASLKSDNAASYLLLHISTTQNAAYILDQSTQHIYRQALLDQTKLDTLILGQESLIPTAQRLLTDTIKKATVHADGIYLETHKGTVWLLNPSDKLQLWGVTEEWQAAYATSSQLQSACAQLIAEAKTNKWDYSKVLTLEKTGTQHPVWYNTGKQLLLQGNTFYANEHWEFIGLDISGNSTYVYSHIRQMMYVFIGSSTVVAIGNIKAVSDTQLLFTGTQGGDNFSHRLYGIPKITNKKSIVFSGGEGADQYHINSGTWYAYPKILIHNIDPGLSPQQDTLTLTISDLKTLVLIKKDNDLLFSDNITLIDGMLPDDISHARTLTLTDVYGENAAASRHLKVQIIASGTSVEHQLDDLINKLAAHTNTIDNVDCISYYTHLDMQNQIVGAA